MLFWRCFMTPQFAENGMGMGMGMGMGCCPLALAPGFVSERAVLCCAVPHRVRVLVCCLLLQSSLHSISATRGFVSVRRVNEIMIMDQERNRTPSNDTVCD